MNNTSTYPSGCMGISLRKSRALATLLLLMVTPIADAALGATVKIDGVEPRQLAVGQTTEIAIAGGKSLSNVQAVEIVPGDGISVKGIRTLELPSTGIPFEDMALRRTRAWIITVAVANDSPIGKRSLVAITPEGRSKPSPIEIVDSTPQVSKLTIVKAERGGRIEFSLLLTDEKSQGLRRIVYDYVFVPELPTHLSYELTKLTVENVDSKTRKVSGVINLFGRELNSSAKLILYVEDQEGHRSNRLASEIQFNRS